MHTNNRNHQHLDSPLGGRSVSAKPRRAVDEVVPDVAGDSGYGKSSSLALIALLISWALLSSSQCFGQVITRDDIVVPLIENEPFDLLTLDRTNMGAVVRILPPDNLILPLPERGDLVFEFAEDGELSLIHI